MSTFWEKSADPRKGETVLHNMAGNLLLKVTRKWKKKDRKKLDSSPGGLGLDHPRANGREDTQQLKVYNSPAMLAVVHGHRGCRREAVVMGEEHSHQGKG